ncbi:23S rRNA (guanosine(2251)-2'-O)-methyltransferase RlmB [Ancylobacter sp. A5.8]|uniref:23S rRNA (guanosine(2251)-2'-O)-methyltransferase RlmB n=1 Tax=Ancylobacter gelatini TaxID=2919920 RepID=UPI001F4EFC10|nr:23S rRNA (guanosine(2251)-2'-O)-methyltransferase RlmB [Ancylobacter gelatini]MCJ8141420.1 23S rRNA (guanosine(2251)-2'-O)-methyltransferase RlmB [Ancylobacter gelatini]
MNERPPHTPKRPSRPFRSGGASQRRERPAGRPFGEWPEDVAILYGWHSVAEALRNPRRKLRRLMATENAMKRLVEEAVPLPFQPEIVRPSEIDRLLEPDAVHQGLLVECDPLRSPSLAEAAENDLILVLDQITDPHNVGAIVRSAAALKVGAIVTTARHSPAATGVLAKAASGGLEHVPFCFVGNLARALEEMKNSGVQVVGLDSEGSADLVDTPLRAPVALVLGAEGKGLRQLTRQTCDTLARIDLPGAIVSLNVSNAAVLALHIARRAIASKTAETTSK